MKKILIKQEQISKGSLMLINPEHPLENYSVNKIPLDFLDTAIELDIKAAKNLEACLNACSMIEDVAAVSGYRSYQNQVQIFDESLKENGEKYTRQFVALPGCSEHQSGLAIDLAEKKEQIDFICPELPYDGKFKTFREQLVQYGFVERYLQGKELITKISPEPWHFRFVGVPHSQIMTEKGWVLEEYMAYLKTTSAKRPLQYTIQNAKFDIWYQAFNAEQEIEVILPERQLFQVSGDNENGVIVTTWRC